MEGVPGTMVRLGHVPGCHHRSLYGHGRVNFRIVQLLEMDVALLRCYSVYIIFRFETSNEPSRSSRDVHSYLLR